MSKKIYANPWTDYELVDAGGGKKLERWGKIYTIRPEIQAYFKSSQTFDEWRKIAHFEFITKGNTSGTWKKLNPAPDKWTIFWKKIQLNLSLTKFKHIGVFPEQNINWDFIDQQLKTEQKFLNLFAYTGAASCVARNRGAETFHVDAVKQLISWAKENMESSRLLNIKWVLDDALKFAKREQKRGNKYQGIIMDPPAYGHGANGEKWILEDKIDELLSVASSLLDEEGFLIVNTYSPTLSIEMLEEMAEIYFHNRQYEVNELWMKSTSGKELYYGNMLRVNLP